MSDKIIEINFPLKSQKTVLKEKAEIIEMADRVWGFEYATCAECGSVTFYILSDNGDAPENLVCECTVCGWCAGLEITDG